MTKRILINGRWPLNLPDHRADRPEWPYWEATRLAAMHHFIEPGDVVYDIGAEAGDFSALFATWGARPVLIEPNPIAWPTIRAVWEANHLSVPPWAICLVSDKENHLLPLSDERDGGDWPVYAFDPLQEAHGFHHLSESHADPQAPFDLLVGAVFDRPPDILTLDVEGAEGHVIRGAHRTLTEDKPAVFASLHPQFMWDLYGETPKDIHDAMKGYGYHGWFLCEDHEQHFVWTHPERRMFPGVAEDYYIPGDRIVL